MKVTVFFFHPYVFAKEQYTAHLRVGSSLLHIKGKIGHRQILQPLEICFLQRDCQCLYPQGPHKAAVLCLTILFK